MLERLQKRDIGYSEYYIINRLQIQGDSVLPRIPDLNADPRFYGKFQYILMWYIERYPGGMRYIERYPGGMWYIVRYPGGMWYVERYPGGIPSGNP